MLPTLKPKQIVLASGKARPAIGRLVIAEHNGQEIIKRLVKTSGEKAYILGDNPAESTDSRKFGWIKISQLTATVIWPK